jgi:phytoene desaturase
MGAFYPEGGMNQITKSIFEYAQMQGVQFYFDTPVQEILLENGRANGLRVKNTEGGKIEDKYDVSNIKHQTSNSKPQTSILFDRVVSNMDVYFTYKKLLPNAKHPEKTLQQERSTSALIFYWGIRHAFPQLNLHNIFFSKDYKNEFDHLANGTVCDDPTVYVNISSKLTPTDAPDGCENWFVMVNVPSNNGQQDWQGIIKRTRTQVLAKVSHNLGIDIQQLIECEAILDPLSIESKTASFGGALYGTSSNALMSAFLRHPNFSSDIEGLYFVGGSVHPGGGIPLALLSAKIVEENFK